jgi:hypothetical protein
MRRTDAFRSILGMVVGLAVIGCGAHSTTSAEPAATPPPKQAAGSPAPAPAEAAESEASNADVGMQFEDKRGDTEREDRAPPPTRAWQPLEKEQPAKASREPSNK